jgi:hypothetical protein
MKKTFFLLTLLTLTQSSFTADQAADAAPVDYRLDPKRNLTIKCGPLNGTPNTYTFKIRPSHVDTDIATAVRTFRIEGTPNDYGVYMKMGERTTTCAFMNATIEQVKAFVIGK